MSASIAELRSDGAQPGGETLSFKSSFGPDLVLRKRTQSGEKFGPLDLEIVSGGLKGDRDTYNEAVMAIRLGRTPHARDECAPPLDADDKDMIGEVIRLDPNLMGEDLMRAVTFAAAHGNWRDEFTTQLLAAGLS